MYAQKIILILLFVFALTGAILFSCTYKKFGEDLDLYQKAKEASGTVWYKNTDIILTKTPGSSHEQPFLKTRYNIVAAANLDANFKVKTGSAFAEESIIVKELYNNNKLELYALLYKKSTHPNADSKGWVWGYINADGSTRIASSKKGKDCSGRHSQSGNQDYGLMNKYFP